ncbi:hypothetical protein [Pelagicoccus sp. SDUM812002]|uniref:hypothetical protein n=1 Tax=Pelagicoccus sp. SDUM812002 TaxID=3041266 RepID=UPI00280EEFA0|nr:hypothetical protein [Pelagicoccus sp. SDUM812002]MDQ8184274.1 hypothetical protein [Pelagicoccus sp. SDUM812002]
MAFDISPDLLTMGVSAAAGFYMKHKAEERKERHAEHIRASERRHLSEASRVRAANVAGKWIRRGLVAAIVFAVILAPFIVTVFTDAQTVLQYSEQTGGKLFGLFGPTKNAVRFQAIDGFLVTPETRQALLAVVAFYFGQGAAK